MRVLEAVLRFAVPHRSFWGFCCVSVLPGAPTVWKRRGGGGVGLVRAAAGSGCCYLGLKRVSEWWLLAQLAGVVSSASWRSLRLSSSLVGVQIPRELSLGEHCRSPCSKG